MSQELVKLLLIGDLGVGKSSLLIRFCNGQFANSLDTIGVDFKMKRTTINDTDCKLQIWDTAGQQKFGTIIANYYNGAHGIILVFDLSSQQSLNKIQFWLGQAKKYAATAELILVGNKCDKQQDRQVSEDEAIDFANQHNLQYIETSALTGQSVNEAFQINVKNVLRSRYPQSKLHASQLFVNSKKVRKQGIKHQDLIAPEKYQDNQEKQNSQISKQKGLQNQEKVVEKSVQEQTHFSDVKQQEQPKEQIQDKEQQQFVIQKQQKELKETFQDKKQQYFTIEKQLEESNDAVQNKKQPQFIVQQQQEPSKESVQNIKQTQFIGQRQQGQEQPKQTAENEQIQIQVNQTQKNHQLSREQKKSEICQQSRQEGNQKRQQHTQKATQNQIDSQNERSVKIVQSKSDIEQLQVQSKQDLLQVDNAQKLIQDHQISAVQEINKKERQDKKKQDQEQKSETAMPIITENPSKKESNTSAEAFNIYEKKIQNAVNMKNQGNTLFKNKQFIEAIQKYSEALRFLDPQSFYGATQAQCQKMAELSATLLYNIGVCYYNVKQFRKGVLFLNEATMVNPKYVKALWKRSLCHYQLGNYDQALDDIKKAYELDKSNKQIYDSYALILKSYNENVKKEKQKMKELSEKMLNKSQSGSPQKELARNQPNGKVIENQKILPQGGQVQGSSFWVVPALIGVAAVGIWAYKKLM